MSRVVVAEYDRTWIGEPKKTLWYSYLNLTWFSMTYFVSSLTEFCAPLAVSLISYELLWCFCCIVEFSEYVTSEWWFSFHLCDVSSDLFGEDLIEKKIVVGLIWVNYFYWPSRPWPTTFWARGKMVEMPIYTLIKHLNAVSTGFIADSQDEI